MEWERFKRILKCGKRVEKLSLSVFFFVFFGELPILSSILVASLCVESAVFRVHYLAIRNLNYCAAMAGAEIAATVFVSDIHLLSELWHLIMYNIHVVMFIKYSCVERRLFMNSLMSDAHLISHKMRSKQLRSATTRRDTTRRVF